MAKDYTVKGAFKGSVSKEDKTPQVISTKAGDCHKYLVQFEGEESKGWIQILRKLDDSGNSNSIEKGDVLFGSLSENNWGKFDFKREQRPEGSPAPVNQRAQTSSAPQVSGSLEQKVDQILEGVELLKAHFLGATTAAQGRTDTVLEDIEDGPADLSEIDY